MGPWGKKRFQIWMIQPPNQGSSFPFTCKCLYNAYVCNYGHLHRKFQLRLYSASIYTISMMNVKKEWHTSSYCLYQCYHAVGSIDITLLQAYVELSKISRFLVCPKCSNVFRDFTGQASLISLRSNQNYILLGQTCCSFFCFECTELSKKRTTPKTQNPI